MNPSGALEHPLRRQILRALIATEEALTAPELVVAIATDANVSAVTYHARVLESAGAVGCTRTSGGANADRYAVTDPPPELIALLEATRDDDASS